MSNSIGKNSIYNLMKSFGQIIFPLITFPYISRTIMAENIGKINFATSIVSYFILIASLGISTYAIRECSKVKNNINALQDVSSQIISINFLTTLFAYLSLLIVLIFVKPLANYRLLIVILSSSILFTTLGADWLNTAMEDFKFITVRTFAFQLFSLILMFIFVHTPDDYYKYALISVISSSGANIVNIFYRKKYCKIYFTLKIEWKKHLSPILVLFVMVLSQTIFCNSDIIILGIFKGDFEVGLYSTSVKIYNIINTLIASIALVVMPQMSYYFSIKKYSEINRLFRYSTSFIFLFGFPAIAGINVLCSDLIVVIAGEEYLGATLSLHILTISLAISLITGLIGNIVLLPSNKEKVFLRACIYAAVANIILNIIFIPIFGLNAAATTTAVSQLITLVVNIKNMNKRIRLYDIKDLIMGPLIGTLCVICLCLLFKFFINELYLRVIMSIIFSAIVYIVSLILLKNKQTLKLLNSFIK